MAAPPFAYDSRWIGPSPMAKDNTAHSAVTFWTPFSTTMPQTTYWINDAHRTLRPGGHLVVVTTPKDYHRVAAAVEDAGFEIRDQIVWLREDFTTNASVVLARKPLEGTVVANVLKWGVGAVHIDANRISTTDTTNQGSNNRTNSVVNFGMQDNRPGEASAEKTYGDSGVTDFTMKPGRRIKGPQSDPSKRQGIVGQGFGFTTNDIDKFQQAQRESIERTNTMGRWPTNTVLTHHKDCKPLGLVEEVVPIKTYDNRGPFGDSQVDKEYKQKLSTTRVMSYACVEDCVTQQFPSGKSTKGTPRAAGAGRGWGMTATGAEYEEEGSAARFFTTCNDWEEFYAHLVNLVTPPEGSVLDPMGHHDIRSVVSELGFHYVDGRHKQ